MLFPKGKHMAFYVAFQISGRVFYSREGYLSLNHKSEGEMGSAGEQPTSNRVYDGE
jgi:hypothetical protein